MKAIDIKKGTWHFWLAKKMNWKQSHQEEVWKIVDGERVFEGFKHIQNDFCSYLRAVMLGMFLFSCLFMVVATYITLVGSGLFYCCMWLFNHSLVAGKIAQAGIAALIVSFVIVGICFLSKWIDDNRDDWFEKSVAKYEAKALAKWQRKQEGKDPFIKAAYDSFKNKVCFKINVT